MLSIYNVSWDIRKQVLGYIIFLKEKQSRKMKGRGCTNRRPQQEYITKTFSNSVIVCSYGIMYNGHN